MAFETVASADVWSWSYHPPLLKPFTQTWKAYTTNAGPDDSTLVLHRWDVVTPFAANFSIANIDFTNFTLQCHRVDDHAIANQVELVFAEDAARDGVQHMLSTIKF